MKTTHKSVYGLVGLLVLGSANASDCIDAVFSADALAAIGDKDAANLTAKLTEGFKTDFTEAHGTNGATLLVGSTVNRVIGALPGDTSPDEAAQKKIATSLASGINQGCGLLAQGQSVALATAVAAVYATQDGSEVSSAVTSGGDSEYYLVVGSGRSITANGGFDTGLEATFRSTTTYENWLAKWQAKESSSKIRGGLEITYRDLDDDAEADFSPEAVFSATKGTLRFDATTDFGYSDVDNVKGIGYRTGLGFSTLPADTGEAIRTKDRYYFGPVFRAKYGATANGTDGTGELFMGFAKDKSWVYEETVTTGDGDDVQENTTVVSEKERFVIDGRMDIPGFFQNKSVRLHTRLFADLPLSGRGASDIRISLLLSVDIGKVFSIN